VLPITRITLASSGFEGYGTAMTTVQAFYLALAAGNGDEAAKFVIPQKRSIGPLSAKAISNYYGNVVEPLTLIDVVRLHPDEFRVRYTFVAQSKHLMGAKQLPLHCLADELIGAPNRPRSSGHSSPHPTAGARRRDWRSASRGHFNSVHVRRQRP
jgi:hypothetical protein